MSRKIIEKTLDVLSIDATSIKQLNKGWSNNKKYIIDTSDRKLSLEIFEREVFNRKKEMYQYMNELKKLGVKVPETLGLLEVDDYGVMFIDYIEGADGEAVLKSLNNEEAYRLGLSAGIELMKIHQIEAPDTVSQWGDRKILKHNRYYKQYQELDYRIENDYKMNKFIDDNIDVIKNRPNVLQHDDYHLGNLIIRNKELVGIIDFDLFDWGDPYHDLIKAGNISVVVNRSYCKGQIDGYFFPHKPNEDFWLIYSIYAAMSVFSSIVWLKKFHPARFDEGMKGIYQMLNDHDYFTRIVPRWYKG